MLVQFVFKVRTQKGEEYSGESLYGLFCGIQHYIRDKKSDCNDEPIDIYLAHFRNSFNAVHSRGICTIKKQASVITEDVETSFSYKHSDTLSTHLDTHYHLIYYYY